MKKLVSGWLVLSLAILVGCAASGPAPAVGGWDVNVTIPQLGELPGTMTVNADGTGLMSLGPLGDTAVDGITFDGNAVNFVVEVDAQGNTLVLEFNGLVDGDTLTGGLECDFGEMTVVGTRQ
ncbi:MAG: hypothetical protein HQ498_04370 [Pseudohongiella sp.]|nr:hypothetical protein [Pseudohongiella sp.]